METLEEYEELCGSCFGYGLIENPDVWSHIVEIYCPTCNGDGHIEK